MVEIKTIKICFATFTVSLMSEVCADEIGAYGTCNLHKLTIRIADGIDPQLQIETLWHEVKHAIHQLADLNDESKEEDFVTRAAPLEIDTLRRNPGLGLLVAGLESEFTIGSD